MDNMQLERGFYKIGARISGLGLGRDARWWNRFLLFGGVAPLLLLSPETRRGIVGQPLELWENEGTGPNATSTGAARPTMTETGVDFNGTSNFMTAAGLTSASTDYTACFVVDKQSAPGNAEVVVSWQGNNCVLYIDLTTFLVDIFDGTHIGGMRSTQRFQMLTFHIQRVGGNNMISFYRDGILLAQSTVARPAITIGSNFNLGRYSFGGQHLNGEMRFAYLHPTALSAGDLATLHSVVAARFGIAFSPNSVLNDGWWTLREPYVTVVGGEVTAATDRSGLAHHLAVVGTGANIVIAAGASPLGLDVCRWPGSGSKRLQAAWARVQPTTVIAHAVISRSNVINKWLCGGTSALLTADILSGAGPWAYMNAGASVGLPGSVVNAWRRTRVTFNGASSAIAQNNGAATTGNPGAGVPGGITLGTGSGGAGPGDCDIAEVVSLPYVPTAQELAALDAYIAAAA